jgi:hypothetical protein
MASWTIRSQHADDRRHPQFDADCRFVPPLEAIVGRRTQAMIAAGVLALSSVAPATGLATETDQEQEGGTVPEQVVAVEQPADPAFDPDGQETDIAFDAPPVPEVQAAPETSDDMTAIEMEPTTEENVPTADPGDGSDDPPLGEQLTPPPAEPMPAPPAPVAVTPEPVQAVPTPAAPAPAETPAAKPDEPEAVAREAKPALPRKRSAEPRAIAAPAAPEAAAPQPAPIYAPTAVTTPAPAHVATVSTRTSHEAIRRGDDVHVVERGESLWSIASDLLGDSASTAEIARKVDGLWELNRSRIDTGDPDLLMTGTRLVLRSAH